MEGDEQMHTLLIADDERIECMTLEKMIRDKFAQIEILPSVNDGASLVQSIEQNHPDIVITDINMPGMTGLEAIELLHLRYKQMQVIINTAYSDFSFAQRAIKCGACDYLLKPCNKQEILHAVQTACDKLDEMNRIERGLSDQQLSDIADILAKKLADQTKEKTVQPPAPVAVKLDLHMETGKVEKKNSHMKDAMEFIRSHYMQDISLDDVAEACGLSPFYMSRMFKQSLDVNFVALLTDVRMEQAVKLLDQGIYSNSEIAKAVGYTSVSYFHKVFRRKTGMTLGDYREAAGLKADETELEEQ